MWMWRKQKGWRIRFIIWVMMSSLTLDAEVVEAQERLKCHECLIKNNKLNQITPHFPPRNAFNNDTVTVNAKIVIKELMDMNVKEETLRVLAWIRMFWMDPRAEWDPEEYGGVHELRMQASDIWVPDMMITNSLENFEVNKADLTFPAIIGYTGLIYWSVPMILHTKCKADVTYFPFDEQNCKIKLNSWTYHEKLMKLEISEFNTGMETRVGNIEWLISNVTCVKSYEANVTNHPLYPNHTIRYPFIEYEIALKRKPDFYVNSLVIPSLLLSWLGAVIFLLPSECGEKLGFSITLFLSLYVNQIIVAEFLPPSADSFPLIARFYTVISLMLGFSIVLTASTLMLHFRISHEMIDENSLLIKLFLFCENLGRKSLFDVLSSLLGSGSRSKGSKSDEKPDSPSGGSKRRSSGPQNNIVNINCVTNDLSVLDIQNTIKITDNATVLDSRASGTSDSNGKSPEGSHKPSKRLIADCSPKIEEYLKDIVAKLAIVAKDDAADIALKRWQLIGAGLDKIFFVVYVLSLLIVSLFFGALALEAKYHLGDEESA